MGQDRGRGRGGRSGSRDDEDDEEGSFRDQNEGEYDEEPEERPRRGGRAAASSGRGGDRGPRGRAPKKPGWSLFGARKPAAPAGRRAGRIDFGAVDQDEDDAPRYREDRDEGFDERDRPAPRRHAGGRKGARRVRLSLMDLATPVFGYAALLPTDSGGIHPGYQQLRDSILSALQRLETEADEHGIDPEDAREARYALALFMDEQVTDSEWNGRTQWAAEPLSIAVAKDPEGGVNFFNHLDSFGERRRDVKKIFFVCLALGFRGTYIQLDPTQQATRLGEIRQKVIRSIHPTPLLDSRDLLFPDGYAPAAPLVQESPPPPRWWIMASLGIVSFCVIVYALLFASAGSADLPADKKVVEAKKGIE